MNTGKIFPKTVFGRKSPGDVPFLGYQVVPAKRRKFEQLKDGGYTVKRKATK